jgi:hypothetical protein
MDFLVSQICDRSRAAGEYGDEDGIIMVLFFSFEMVGY